MILDRRTLAVVVSVVLAALLAASPALGGPTVVPTAEGQIGPMPDPDESIFGPYSFEAFHLQMNKLAFGGISVAGGALPPPPEVQFFTDLIHGGPLPVQIGAEPSLFANIDRVTPDSSGSLNAAGDGDFVAFSFAVDGTMPQTLTVRIATFDEDGMSLVQVPVPGLENLDTFAIPVPEFAETGVAVDEQGRVAVAYTEFVLGAPELRAARVDGTTGAIIDPGFPIASLRSDTDVALLDPAGNRLVVVSTDYAGAGGGIGAHQVNFTGPTPVVGALLPINQTAGLLDINPAIAADPATGTFTVAWEKIVDVPGDPVNVRARRFDSMGNPLGDAFTVNTTTADAQGQPAVAYGPDGLSAIVWAGDVAGADLDVFLQVYDPSGNPIGPETIVNTFVDDFQDRPSVRFLPEPDSQGRPQVTVAWRDVGQPDGGAPRGTGVSYRCFSIDGFEDPMPIFADGFESGDTSSWSTVVN